MQRYTDEWLKREQAFSAFTTGPLLDFWRQREEDEFVGVGGIPIRFVRFRSVAHRRVIVLVPGRIESYVKYPEVAYDLFRCGYDVLAIDHRGQGRSGRLLRDHHRGHVQNFDDYVDDFARFWQLEMDGHRYERRFALAHSMGGAILALFLARQPESFDAAALCAPMTGISLPMPEWLAQRIVDWAEQRPRLSRYYAVGTGQWRPLPYIVNTLTHSRPRYQRMLRYYADMPEIQVGGPTYHWVRESLLAGRQLLARAGDISTPLLLLQASEDRVVSNASQEVFCQALKAAGHPCEGGAPLVIKGARHELLFERDSLRAEVLSTILRFFAQHHAV